MGQNLYGKFPAAPAPAPEPVAVPEPKVEVPQKPKGKTAPPFVPPVVPQADD